MHDNKELWYRQPARYWEETVLYTDTMQDRILYREGKRERIHLEPGIPFVITPEKE